MPDAIWSRCSRLRGEAGCTARRRPPSADWKFDHADAAPAAYRELPAFLVRLRRTSTRKILHFGAFQAA
jgi:hypothetical protein